MKKASRIMYTLGLIFSIIALVAIASSIVVGIVSLTQGKQQEGLALIIWGSVYFVIYLVIIILAGRARAQTNKGSKNHRGWHILMIVLGAVGFDIFYILGGVFGLIAD